MVKRKVKELSKVKSILKEIIFIWKRKNRRPIKYYEGNSRFVNFLKLGQNYYKHSRRSRSIIFKIFIKKHSGFFQNVFSKVKRKTIRVLLDMNHGL